MQRSYYRLREGCRRSETRWVTGFIENLIRITHDQWTWRNEKLHYRKHPGAETRTEYEQIMNRIMNQLEMTNPEDLLPEDRFLLDVDPEDLINTSPDGRQAWLANFDTAVASAEHEKRKRDDISNEDSDDDDNDMHPHYIRPPPPQSRCVIQAGQRWRNQKHQKNIKKRKKHKATKTVRKSVPKRTI